ncbi:MAG: hypothetical protein ACRD0C_18850 [Acidimicrobiia bacterium]
MDTVSIDTLLSQGLITAEQAEALRTAVGAPTKDGAAPSRRHRVLPLVAEALGYVGGTVAFSGAAAATSTFWADLVPGAQVALLALVTGLLLLAGAGVPSGEQAHPALRRLGSVLWFLSGAAFAGTVGLGLDEFLFDVWFDAGHANFVATAAATAGYAGALWWFRRRSLQQIGSYAAVVATVVAVLAAPDHPPSSAWFGLAIAGLGAAWAVLGWGGLLRPERTALVLGSLGVLAGAEVIAFESGWGLVLGLAAAGGLVGGGVVLHRAVLIGLGAAGLLVYLPQSIGRWLGDSVGAALVLMISGLAVVATGVLVARLRSLEERA